MRNLLILTAIIGTAVSTMAASKQYVVGSGSTVDAYDDVPSNSGLEIHHALDAALNGHSFPLNDGQTTSFPFFKIWTPETHVHVGEDDVPKTITATLDFSIPGGPTDDPDISGVTFGGYVGIPEFGDIPFGQKGYVQWDPTPVTIVAADRTFEVWLSDAEFNYGWFGLDEGEGSGATVYAYVKQISSTGVPDGGATMTLLAGSLAGFAVVGRRLRR